MFGFRQDDRTDIVVLLDRSGSMQAVHGQTVEGFQSFVDKQKRASGDCRLTLAQFDTVYETVYRNRPMHRVPALQLKPRGGTALLDAMGKIITETAERTEALDELRRPARQLVVIITDGQENSSREFTREQVFAMVRHYTTSADWQFVFLGANQDAIGEAQRMGIDAGAAMSYKVDCVDNAWGAVGDAVFRHQCSHARRVAGSYFTADERRAAQERSDG